MSKVISPPGVSHKSRVNHQSSIVLIGSTGSIGTQTVDILRRYPYIFDVIGLVAYKNKIRITEQKKYFPSSQHVLVQQDKESEKKIEKLIDQADIIINAVSGMDGMDATKTALKKGKKLLLANKESLVSCGNLTKYFKKGKIIPIDSELTGILQCLQNGKINEIEKIILPCSGGPFHGKNRKELEKVTLREALRHPKWNMGRKISIDSATLMNKGFELIAITNLFGIPEDKIEIVIHPESVVHALVQWRDGNISACLSPVDMHYAIEYALFYPDRRPNNLPRLNFTNLKLTFEKPDEKLFTALGVARKAAQIKGKMPFILNKKNDEAVEKFLNGEISFLEIFNQIQI